MVLQHESTKRIFYINFNYKLRQFLFTLVDAAHHLEFQKLASVPAPSLTKNN